MKTFSENITLQIRTMILLLAVFFYAGFAQADVVSNCEINRGGLDVGSTGIKWKFAKIDVCKSKMIQVFLEGVEDVGFGASLGKTDGIDPKEIFLPREIMDQGLVAIKRIQEKIAAYSKEKNMTVSGYVGVATEAFRLARGNSESFFNEVLEKTGAKVIIISNATEGAIEFLAVSSNAPAGIDPARIVVIGIGGGSIQVGAKGANGQLLQYLGTTSSNKFKTLVIEKAQGKDPKAVTSPNPLSEEDVLKAYSLGLDAVASKFGVELTDKLKEAQIEVFAVGRIQNTYAKGAIVALVPGRKEEPFYTPEGVSKAIVELIGKNDEEIAALIFNDNGKKYDGMDPDKAKKAKADDLKLAQTTVTNLILIGSIIEHHQIRHVKYTKVNLTDGLYFLEDLRPIVKPEN